MRLRKQLLNQKFKKRMKNNMIKMIKKKNKENKKNKRNKKSKKNKKKTTKRKMINYQLLKRMIIWKLMNER